MTSARRTRRPRREQARPFTVLSTGLLVLALLAGVLTVALRSPGGVPGVSYGSYEVALPDAGNLRPHNEVRIAGVRVGQVASKDVRDGQALLRLKLDSGTGPLPRDTTVFIRSRGLLGQRYLELVPGRSSTMLAQDATIRSGTDSLTFGVPETLDTFDTATRQGLGTTFGELGRGLLGRGDDLNGALRVVAPTGRRLRTTIGTVLERDGAVARLAPSLNAAATPLDGAREDIARGLKPGADALTPFADHGEDVQQLLAEAPPALRTARAGLDGGARLLASVRTVARAADGTLPAAPAALRQTATLLRTSREPLRRTTRLLKAAGPAVPALVKVTDALEPDLKLLTNAANALRPTLVTVGQHGCDVKNFATVWRSFLGFGVAGGGAIGPLNSIRVVATPAFEEIRGQGELITSVTEKLVDHDPYPRPCKFVPGAYYPVSLTQGAPK
ncbi:hypothetical protein DSM112329_01723 [Paraconexibacter sp. AEG42_29]|uniref:Mce/MlaD domain-containing protein n=1 Tax=Paraconexibacter sp. AEG42_29 TaxID=2997339 RepID=A0AAU7ATA9_9ACTN